MRRGSVLFVGLAVAAGGNRVVGAEPDLGAEVRGVFAARCARCHGADLSNPKGRFGYVLDLRRVAGNPEMVIPGRPDESELWVLVSHGEMPPADSPGGALSGSEKEVIRAWIAAGAPDMGPRPPASWASPVQPEPASPSPGRMAAGRALRLVGKFHVLLVHFPIALLFAAGVAEARAAWRRSDGLSRSARFCLALAAVTVVPTVALGWIHAAYGYGAGSPGFLLAHAWLGTVTGVWVIGTALWAERDARRGQRARGVQVAMAVGITLVVAAGHFGGLIVHGRDYFDW